MATFQFYVKEKTAIPLDVDSISFLVEKEQLVKQGFERIGDVLQAPDSEQALDKFKTIHLSELQDFANSHLFVGGVDTITQIIN